MVHPFEIPEILYLICEQARRSDLARLLTVSRLFFECATPFMWRNLPETAPMILLKLLPDADLYLNLKRNANLVETLLESLTPPDKRSLARFNLYAPHVKQISRHLQNQRWNVAWNRLFKLVDAHPILPNLELFEVILATRYSVEGVSAGFASSLAPFLSPKMLEINSARAIDAYPYVGPQTLTQLIYRIAQGCPNLNCLRLKITTDRSPIGASHDPTELAGSLGQLRNLRAIQLGLAVLEPKVLAVLGTLPHLESLALDEPSIARPSDSDKVSTIPSSCLSHDSFPVLRHLSVRLHSGFELAYKIWGIAPLVCRLTFVSVHVFGEATHTQIRNFINIIHQCSPLVTSLHIDSTDLQHISLLASSIVHSLTRLPLQRLQLLARDDPSRGYYDGGEQLWLALPNLESLEIHGYTFSFNDLALMAKHMPRLRDLSVPVRADRPRLSEHHLLENHSPSSRLKLHFLEHRWLPCFPKVVGFGTLNAAVELIAALLHALWPSGVTCISSRKPDTYLPVIRMEQINAQLEWLREADGRTNGTV